ncbi:MAG TPA: hypothetical protein VI319_01650 [Burkholderiales bacterium]
MVELLVRRAVALHQRTLAPQRQVGDRGEHLGGGVRLGGRAVDAHAPRAQRRGGLRPARGDDGLRERVEQLRRRAERVGRLEQRARPDAGLEHGQFRRAHTEPVHEAPDRIEVDVGRLGERGRGDDARAAPGDQPGELRRQPALEDRDRTGFHCVDCSVRPGD